jgi:hypothetical protein
VDNVELFRLCLDKDERFSGYDMAVKEELLLAKGLHSMSFAAKEDLAAAQS